MVSEPDDFDFDEYDDVPDLTREQALAWHRFRRTAGWPKHIEQVDLDKFIQDISQHGGLTEQQTLLLLENHCGFDGQDWSTVLEALGYPDPMDSDET
jgi:hypothetical protein